MKHRGGKRKRPGKVEFSKAERFDAVSREVGSITNNSVLATSSVELLGTLIMVNTLLVLTRYLGFKEKCVTCIGFSIVLYATTPLLQCGLSFKKRELLR